MNKNKFYVTTPIYYATAKPHLGTLYSTILADIAARWARVRGIPTFFLTGTDEFGQKIAQAAQAAGMEPKAFLDQSVPAYKDLWKKYAIEYNHFIRTTDENHIKGVQEWIMNLQKKGDIYKGEYAGWYCIPCETHLTEKDFEKGTENPPCVSCQRPTTWVSEECYFFRLSNYQDRLLQFYKEHPHFITPKERAAEVVRFVEGGLQDLSISRTVTSWGVPFPGDEKHVTYVWADALNNYITGVGYAQKGREAEFATWWPADLQVMGKDIVRFHAIYWPAFLMASDLPLPKKLLVHGWIKVGDQKMSKSLGNAVDPETLLQKYGADAVRYYLARQLAITQDGQFSLEDLEQKISSDLANDLGNLLQRMIVLAEKQNLSTLHPAVWTQKEEELFAASQQMITLFTEEMDRGFSHMALSHVWRFLNQTNAYFHALEPWKLGKTDPAGSARVLSATAHALRAVSVLVWPVMPRKMEELCTSLGCVIDLETNNVAKIQQEWKETFILQKGNPLFEKPEPKVEQEIVEKVAEAIVEKEYITIDDLIKVELRVGTIKECVIVPESDKLLRMQIDMGSEGMRQIFAGIRKSYQPDQLIGKQGIFVANLKPRKMMGQESQGMMLVAEDAQGNVVLVSPERDAVNGAKLR